MRSLLMMAVILLFGIGAREACAVDPYAGNDPYWVLLHEPAVIAELKMSPAQRQSLQQFTDKLDLRCFPLRNKTPEVALAGAADITAEIRDELNHLLESEQRKRLNELQLRYLGNRALLHDEVAIRLRYSDAQKRRISEINDATQKALEAIQKAMNDGTSRESAQKKFTELQTDQQKKLLSVLKPEQRTALKTVLGPPFDLSQLGQPRFKAPELVDAGAWINSSPLRLEKLRGKVVVVHFYASGCINCIHNYPSYRQWHKEFQDKNVVLIGIHTPETENERNVANVRRKAADEKLDFPILIDGQNENWNAWGNSMWPCVYLIDKHGYLREFWPGELKWQGNDGEKYMRERIEGLLVEHSP